MSLAARCCSIKSESVYKRVKSDRHAETLTFKGETLPLKKKKKFSHMLAKKRKYHLRQQQQQTVLEKKKKKKLSIFCTCVREPRTRVRYRRDRTLESGVSSSTLWIFICVSPLLFPGVLASTAPVVRFHSWNQVIGKRAAGESREPLNHLLFTCSLLMYMYSSVFI